MNRWLGSIAILGILTLSIPAREIPEERLAEILKKAAAYCEKVKSAAIHFYCRQTMDETDFTYREVKIVQNDQITPAIVLHKKKNRHNAFDYQMVRDDKQLFENRLPMGSASASGRDIAIGDASGTLGNSKTGVPSLPSASGQSASKNVFQSMRTQYIVYGPVSFLSRYWQRRFIFSLQGKENREGKTVLIIQAEPKEEGGENNYRARIWIDTDDAAVLKIIYEPRSLAAYPKLPEPPLPDMQPRLQVELEYALLKNGVRFPTRESIRYYFSAPGGEEYNRYQAEITYSDYRFFIVEATAKVEE